MIMGLDKCIMNLAWADRFENWKYKVHARSNSDHSPLRRGNEFIFRDHERTILGAMSHGLGVDSNDIVECVVVVYALNRVADMGWEIAWGGSTSANVLAFQTNKVPWLILNDWRRCKTRFYHASKEYTPYHFAQYAPQPMQSASQSESGRRSGKNKQKVEDTLDKLDQLIEVIKTQGEREELAKQDTRGKKLSKVLGILQEMELLGYLMTAEMTKACLKLTEHLKYADMIMGLATLESKKLYLM
ncbi:hypothetical protein GIB67_019660 [Kingdonia uniflora]|uniref:Uncharacterized protein n=1 Tax=Kingdonia uniflora TaxID=39325 RepID=A0A7J7MK17_9MAGN|nr:hypothetical protein GIB67_019660 [Kingdonia uniflora]